MASLSGLPGVSRTAGDIAQAVNRLGGNAFQTRCASSASSRWKSRQGSDHYAREARLKGMKSRAAFKLIEVWTVILALFPPPSLHVLPFPLPWGPWIHEMPDVKGVANDVDV